MKKIALITVLAIVAIAVCVSCEKEEYKPGPVMIEGLTLQNFPVMDGSTSTDPLVKLVAARLLGYKAAWELKQGYITWSLETNLPKTFVEQRLKCSQTHGSFINLVDGGADIIFSARRMSADEKAYADAAGVALIETPVALDALVFMVNAHNPVSSLTHGQLEDIYTAKVKNWNEVGGEDMEMIPFVRNRNSGSQELMESLVMTGPIPDGFYEDHFEDYQIIIQMAPVFSAVARTPGGLGYTVYYYMTNIMRQALPIAVNGVFPDRETIGNRSYPFTAEVYAIIRSDLDKSSMAYKIYELMQTSAGKRIIEESGYVAN